MLVNRRLVHAGALLPLNLFMAHQVFGGSDFLKEAQLLNPVVILTLSLYQGNLGRIVPSRSLFRGVECFRHGKLYILFPYTFMHAVCLVGKRPVA